MTYYAIYECRTCGEKFTRGPQQCTEAEIPDRMKEAAKEEIGHTAWPLLHTAELSKTPCLPNHAGVLEFVGFLYQEAWPALARKILTQ